MKGSQHDHRNHRAAQAQAAADALAVLPKVEPAADHVPAVTQLIEQPASVLSEKAAADANARAFVDSLPTLKLGEINTRLGYTVSAEFLASLGFVATTERSAKLYREQDFQAICRKIADHTLALAFRKAA